MYLLLHNVYLFIIIFYIRICIIPVDYKYCSVSRNSIKNFIEI